MTDHQLVVTPFTTTLWTWPLRQFFSPSAVHLSKTSLTAFQMNATGGCIKTFTNIQVHNIYSLSFIHQAGQLLINGNQVGQAGPAFTHPCWLGLLFMPYEDT